MKKFSKILMFLVLAVFLMAGSASATPLLTLSDGSTTITVIDEGVGDASLGTAGVVSYNGAVGTNWMVNVTTGLTKPVIGGMNFPYLDLNSVNVSSGSAGTMNITFEEDGFYLPDTLPGFNTEIGGTTNGTVWLTSKYDDISPYDFAAGVTVLSSLGPLGTGAFSATDVKLANPIDPFALRLEATITHTGAGQITSFDASINPAVPEPATLLLLGSGLVGLAGIGRKKFFKKA